MDCVNTSGPVSVAFIRMKLRVENTPIEQFMSFIISTAHLTPNLHYNYSAHHDFHDLNFEIFKKQVL